MAAGGPQVNLSCSVCLEEFRTPKVLSCGHTYCLRCVDRLVERNGMNLSLQCPVCRTQVAFPASGRTEDLITNFQLVSMLDQSRHSNTQGPQIQSPLPNDAHQRKSDGGEDAKSSGSECAIHGIENQLYCQSCKVPVCVNCTLSEHDVDHHGIVSKKNFVREQQKRVDNLMEKLPVLRAKYAELARTVDAQKEKYVEESARLEREVRHVLSVRQRQLAEEATNLLRVIKEYGSEPETKNQEFCNQLSSQNSLLEVTETQAKSVKEELDAQKFTDETKLGKIAENVARVERELESIGRDFRSVPNKPSLAFQPSNTKEKLGYLIHQSANLPATSANKQMVKHPVGVGRFLQSRPTSHLMPPIQGRVQPLSRPSYLPNMGAYLGAYNQQYPPYNGGGLERPYPPSPSGSEVSLNSYGDQPLTQREAPDTWHILPGNENWILKADETWSNNAPHSDLLNLSDFT